MRIAVHLHLYYLEQLAGILTGLRNLQQSCIPWDLFVTMPHPEPDVEEKLRALCPDAEFWYPENRGYDVGAFIDFLHHIKLDKYDYILKIHTKRSRRGEYCYFNGIRFNTKVWGRALSEALWGTPENIRQNIAWFEENPDIGMVGSAFFLTSESGTYKMLESNIQYEARKIGLPPIEDFRFIAGTMFFIRSKLLYPFLRYTLADFEPAAANVRDYTLAHCLERLLSQSVSAQGFRIQGVKYKTYHLAHLQAEIMRFLIQSKITKNGRKILKICKIPVWSSRETLPAYPIYKGFGFATPKKRRLAIYAAWDHDGNVDKADLYYIRALKEVADNVIYVVGNNLVAGEAEKLSRDVAYVLAEPHEEYDFGSYKRGLACAEKHGLLEKVDELIFCNDSCYAPVYPFAPVFAKMKHETCDFWGITENTEFYRHIQSYFMVFRRKVFTSKAFKDFLSGISPQKNVQAVIEKYEIGLSRMLFEKGFVGKSWLGEPEKNAYFPRNVKNPTFYPLYLIRAGAPILKKKSFLFNNGYMGKGLLRARFYAIRINHKLKNVLPSYGKIILRFLIYKITHFFYQQKVTNSGKKLIKICKIPVYSKKTKNMDI